MNTPRRSLLYMPGANSRAVEKAKSIDCDVVIFDLEDAVAPESKALARSQVIEAISGGGYGHRELVVRVNSLNSDWGYSDIEVFAEADISAMLFPKVESVHQLEKIDEVLDKAYDEVFYQKPSSGDYKYDADVLSDSIAEQLGKGSLDELPQTYQTQIHNTALKRVTQDMQINQRTND